MNSVIESKFQYKGYDCVVLFNRNDIRCGYVFVPKGHKYFGKDYGEVDIDCHCGITYGGWGLPNTDENEQWVIGFDCGHFEDGTDVEAIKRYFNREPWYIFDGEVRTVEYCENECKKIVDQLVRCE